MIENKPPRSGSVDRFVAVCLIIAGLLCLLQAATKPLLWFAGSRAAGHVTGGETAVTRIGAMWTYYTFQVPGQGSVRGSAMTAAAGAPVFMRMQVAYLPLYPELNMPAYGGYAAALAIGWILPGVALLAGGLALRRAGRRGADPALCRKHRPPSNPREGGGR